MASSAFTGEQWKIKVSYITRNAVSDFLSRQRAYTLHKPARRHFPRNRIYVGSIDKQWQAELADMVGLQRDNNGNRYILTVLDVFLKYAWSVPAKRQRWEIYSWRVQISSDIRKSPQTGKASNGQRKRVC